MRKGGGGKGERCKESQRLQATGNAIQKAVNPSPPHHPPKNPKGEKGGDSNRGENSQGTPRLKARARRTRASEIEFVRTR